LDKLFAPKSDDNRATEIAIESLKSTASATKAGTRASAAQRDRIKELV